ncbi:MAG: hypothetical protein MI919_42785 [Holophagales bacterium]|nr:hypothetical protein [Holophagales bacterium]
MHEVRFHLDRSLEEERSGEEIVNASNHEPDARPYVLEAADWRRPGISLGLLGGELLASGHRWR